MRGMTIDLPTQPSADDLIKRAGEALLGEIRNIAEARAWLEAAEAIPLDERQKDLLAYCRCTILCLTEDYDEAYAMFETANAGRDTPNGWRFLGCVVYLKREPGDDPALTLREIDTAIRWAKEHDGSVDHDGLVANLYGHKAFWHLRSEQIDDAVACCQIAMKMYPDYVAPLSIMAEIALRRARPEEAVGYLSESIARRTVGPRLFDYANRGKALLDMGNAPAAYADLSRALSLEPDNPTVLSNLGIAADEMGNTSLAWQMYNAALLQDTNWAAAYHNRAVLWYRNDDHEKADRDFTNAVLREPSNGLLWFSRGACRFQRKMHGECLADLAEAYRRGYRNWDLQYLSGMCKGYLNEHTTGMSILRSVIDQFPSLSNGIQSMVWNNLGTIAHRKGEHRTAHECFVKALSTDPLNRQAAANTDRIEEIMSGQYDQPIVENEVGISVGRLLSDSSLDDIRLSDVASFASLAVGIATLL